MVVFLLEENAEIDKLSAQDETPLSLAIQGKHWETARILLEHGADPALKNSQGQTPLMSAVMTGEEKLVNLMLHHPTYGRQNSELNTTDFIGNTPLMISAAHGFLEIVKLLLELGAKVENRNRWQESALILAASKGFREIVNLLIQYGADFHAEDVNEKTALLRAAQNGHLFVVELLLSQGANLHVNAFDMSGEGGTPLIQAARYGHSEVLLALMRAGAVIDEVELMFHHSALMVAALNGHEKTVDILLNAGADPMLKDSSGRSALLLAASNNHLSLVIQLLDAGQKWDQKDTHGNGIWHLMAMSDVEIEDSETSYGSGQKEEGASMIMHELISRGVLLDSLNSAGETALMIGVKRGKVRTIKSLLELGASPDIQTPDGESALTLAKTSGNDELVKLLR
jgi:ankyrin repeat protein